MKTYTLLIITLFLLGIVVGQIISEKENETDPKRGCEASAYQATKNGFDLEENLLVCKD